MTSDDQGSTQRCDRAQYLVVLAALAVVQVVRMLGNSCRLLAFTMEATSGALPLSQWWTAVDIRSAFWIAVAPPLALIVVKRESPFFLKAGSHVALFVAGVLVSGGVMHRLAHQQTMAREEVRGMPALAGDVRAGSSPEYAASSPPSRVRALMSYDTASGFPKYGVRFWTSEALIGLADYSMMAFVGYAVMFFRISEHRSRQAERLRGMLTQARHDALCNRLTHHFLFNTLNSISALTLTNGAAARSSISQLGELLRASIDTLPQGEVRLDAELKNLKLYLTLQENRFGGRLEYSIDIDSGLGQALVPAFLLQPLVENSFQHGFREKRGVARVWIVARQDGECVQIEVADNGVELNDPSTIDERYGVGVTRQRLKLQYGGAADISFEPNQPSGLRVSILIPYRSDAGSNS